MPECPGAGFRRSRSRIEIGAEKFLRLLLENLKGNYCQ
jgi:hypothetical protein